VQRYNIIFKFPQLAHFYFLSWRIFASLVGAFLLPQLAHFCFLSWRIFASSVGAFLLPQLAKQQRIRLQNFRK